MSFPIDRLSTEIFLEILSYLQYSGQILRVSNHWLECGISFVWQDVHWYHLHDVWLFHRPVYAAHIRSLSVGPTSWSRIAELDNLEFPKLTQLKMEEGEPSTWTNTLLLKPFLRAGIRAIDFEGEIDPELLLYIHSHCHRLQKLSLRWPGQSITADLILETLEVRPCLTDVSLHGIDVSPSDACVIFEKISRLDKLMQLDLDFKGYRGFVEETKVTNPFKALQSLSLSITWVAVPLLVPIVPRIQGLELCLSTTGGYYSTIDKTALRSLSNLEELRCLKVSMNNTLEISRNGLGFLNSLKHLTELRLLGDIKPVGFEVSELESRFADLPNLRILELLLRGLDLTTISLAVLGRSCRCLELCSLPGEFNMLQLSCYDAPLFPRLKFLWVPEFSTVIVDQEGKCTEDEWP
ncbi:hypothetical protein BBP40_000351 [Aspergillus hancockii]|nr:hypothetical protein BBP40_000351 [Aspergillus hancockii]